MCRKFIYLYTFLSNILANREGNLYKDHIYEKYNM